jgi:hypothetical protein
MRRTFRSLVIKTVAKMAAVSVITTAAAASARGPARSSKPSEPPNQCTFKGASAMPAGLVVYDKLRGGKAFARFPGAPVTLMARRLPADPSKTRAAVRTGSGSGGFRINGFVDATRLPLYTTREIAVFGSHLRLGEARRVQFVRASPTRLRVKLSLAQPMQQTFYAWASCSDVSLSPGVPPGWAVPGNGQGHVVDTDQVSLYDDWGPQRNLVTVLKHAQGMLMWATGDPQSGFVRVVYHGSVVIDAWAELGSFRVLPPGETEDRLLAPTHRANPPTLRVSGTPQEVFVENEATLRSAPRDNAPKIGVIEPRTPTYVLDIVLGWASVLPKSLNVAPYGDQQFWVRASEIGIES